MKTTVKFTLLILIFLCNCSKVENVENRDELTNSCFPNVNDRYVYPIVPGTDEWRRLPSTDEAFKVIQLPESVLKTISTKGLIDALIHAPLFSGSYSLSSSYAVDTWHRHYSRFNSTQELFNRKNSGDTLVDYYKEVNCGCIEKSDLNLEKERLFGLEFLFTKQEILEKISKQKKQELVVALLSCCENSEDLIEVVPMAWVMLNDNYEPMLKYYIENEKLYSESIQKGYIFSAADQSNRIISIARNYINKK